VAIVTNISNHYKYTLLLVMLYRNIKAILLNPSFIFDQDAHATLADVTAYQLPTSNGYTQDDKTLANKLFTEDDENDQARLSCDDVSWTASGGDIGPFRFMILYDGSSSDDAVIGCADFGENNTIPNGQSWIAKDIVLELN